MSGLVVPIRQINGFLVVAKSPKMRRFVRMSVLNTVILEITSAKKKIRPAEPTATAYVVFNGDMNALSEDDKRLLTIAAARLAEGLNLKLRDGLFTQAVTDIPMVNSNKFLYRKNLAEVLLLLLLRRKLGKVVLLLHQC